MRAHAGLRAACTALVFPSGKRGATVVVLILIMENANICKGGENSILTSHVLIIPLQQLSGHGQTYTHSVNDPGILDVGVGERGRQPDSTAFH